MCIKYTNLSLKMNIQIASSQCFLEFIQEPTSLPKNFMNYTERNNNVEILILDSLELYTSNEEAEPIHATNLNFSAR